MKKNKIPWWDPIIGEYEKKYINEVLNNNFPNEGPKTIEFQEQICRLLKCKFAIAVPSATSAMFLSLKALGVGYGDEVIVPDITFIATANAVEMSGAKPILADINPKNLTISIESINESITSKTKAIIPVHVTGRGADMNPILEIAKKNDLHIVEDAAEALTSKYSGKFLGTFGDTGCFSFSPHKTITTGQGGMIVTDNEETYLRLIELKDQGRPIRGTGGDDTHKSIGYNFKYTDLQAAVGLGQLHYLRERIKTIKRINKIYTEELSGTDQINFFKFKSEEVPQWTDIHTDIREDLSNHLNSQNMETRNYWFPIHTQKPYKQNDKKFPNSLKMSKTSLWLPSAYTLSDEDVMTVSSNIRKFLK